MRKLLLSLALVLTTALGWAVAQTTPLYNWTHGGTLVNLTLPSGSGVTVPISVLTSTTGLVAVPAGTTVTTTGNINAGYTVAIGAITTWGITLPNPANHGQVFCISNGTGSTFSSNTTVTAPAGGTQTQSLAQTYSSQSLTAGASACWAFNLGLTGSTGTWYRVQ